MIQSKGALLLGRHGAVERVLFQGNEHRKQHHIHLCYDRVKDRGQISAQVNYLHG